MTASKKLGTKLLLLVGIAAALATGWRIMAHRTEATAKLGALPDANALPVPPERVMPAEFEPCEAVLLSWADALRHEKPLLQKAQFRALAEIVAAIWQHVDCYILVKDAAMQQDCITTLASLGVPAEGVTFLTFPVNSIWIRDFGPTTIRTADGGYEWTKAHYIHLLNRSDDDHVATRLSESFGVPLKTAPIIHELGNHLSNGMGLCLTTKYLPARNETIGYDESDVTGILREFYGATDVVYLDPLDRESTGHVDVFATFTAPDQVVVGQFSAAEDLMNSAILDRNAERLSGRPTPVGPLKVERIPMPPRGQDVWGGSYTNVVYASGVLLVPTYPAIDPVGSAAALRLYRRLLPGWKVVGIDCRAFTSMGGGLHCVTLNVCGFRQKKHRPPAPNDLANDAAPVGAE